MRSITRILPAALVVALGLSAGCNLNLSHGVEARDQWKRSYTLAAGGAVEIKNTNGKISVEVGEGNTVDVVADRVVRASTDEAAKDLLAKFEIRESVSADRVALDSTGSGVSFDFHVNRRVDYTVRVPRSAAIRLSSTNGEIDARGIGGALQIETTNGRIKGVGLENSASVETTNGTVSLEFVKLGERGVSCETTNGTIDVTLPRDAKARLSARVTNGGINTSGLELQIAEQSRKRLDASIGGGGGPEIRLETTNGMISVRGK